MNLMNMKKSRKANFCFRVNKAQLVKYYKNYQKNQEKMISQIWLTKMQC